MDLSTAVFLVLATIATSLWLRLRRKRMSVFERLGIPGPKPNLILGNLSEFGKLGNVGFLKKCSKQYGKVYGYYLGGHPFLVIGDTELCKQIQIKDFHSFSDRPAIFRAGGGIIGDKKYGKHIITTTGNEWKKQRSLVSTSFTSGKIKKMMPFVTEAIDVLMGKVDQKAATGTEFDIYEMYKSLTLDVIGRVAFGIETNVQLNDNDPFLFATKHLLPDTGFFTPLLFLGLAFPEFEFIVGIFHKVFGLVACLFGENHAKTFADSCAQVVKARRANPKHRRDDLLQLLLDAEVSAHDVTNASISALTATGGYESEHSEKVAKGLKTTNQGGHNSMSLTDNEVIGNTFVVFFAGYETTSTALAFTTHIIVNDQILQDNLRKEIKEVLAKEGILDYSSLNQLKLLDQVFSESLRYYPPVTTFVNRNTNHDTQCGHLTIPKDMNVQIPVPVIHRDPDYWSEPDKFDPERFSAENRSNINSTAYQAFGGGPRNCIGMRFAQLEAKLALACLLKDYKILPSAKTEKGDIEVLCKFAIMAPKNGVFLKAQKIE